MKLWLEGRLAADQVAAILQPGSYPQTKWTVRADWLAAFVQTAEYQKMHRGDKDADPLVQLIQAALIALGWPERIAPHCLGFNMPARRVPGLMAYLGYFVDRNPEETRGRWLIEGRQVVMYRRKVE